MIPDSITLIIAGREYALVSTNPMMLHHDWSIELGAPATVRLTLDGIHYDYPVRTVSQSGRSVTVEAVEFAEAML